MIAGFVSMPILTRILTKSQYGILNLVSITLFILLAVAKFGLQHSAVRFFDEFKNGKRKEDISVFYTTLFWGCLILSTVVGAVFWILGQFLYHPFPSERPGILLLLVAGMVITGSMIIRFINFLRVEQRTKSVNLLKIIDRYVALALSLAFVYIFSKTIEIFFSGKLLVEFLVIVTLSYLFFKQHKIKLKGFSLPFFKECIWYGFPLVGFELAGFFMIYSDRYLIQYFLGSEAVGVYSVGSNLCYYIKDILYFPMWYAISPLYMELYSNKGIEETREFISKNFNYLLLISIPMIIGFSVLGKQIITILASSKYESAAVVIPYILTGTLAWSFYPLYASGLFIYKQTKKLPLLVFICGGLNIILNIILIPRLDLLGAALATFISYIILTGLVMAVSFKYLKIHIEFPKIFKYVFACVPMSIIIYFIGFDIGILSVLIKTITGIITYFFVLLCIDKNIRLKVIKLIIR